MSRPLSRKNWSAWKRRKLFVFFLTLGRRTAGVGPFTISAGGGADDDEEGKGEEVACVRGGVFVRSALVIISGDRRSSSLES